MQLEGKATCVNYSPRRLGTAKICLPDVRGTSPGFALPPAIAAPAFRGGRPLTSPFTAAAAAAAAAASTRPGLFSSNGTLKDRRHSGLTGQLMPTSTRSIHSTSAQLGPAYRSCGSDSISTSGPMPSSHAVWAKGYGEQKCRSAAAEVGDSSMSRGGSIFYRSHQLQSGQPVLVEEADLEVGMPPVQDEHD